MHINTVFGSREDRDIRFVSPDDPTSTFVPDIGQVIDGVVVLGIEIIRSEDYGRPYRNDESLYYDQVYLHGREVGGKKGRRTKRLKQNQWGKISNHWKEGFVFRR